FELSKKINDKIAEVSSLTTLGAVLQKQGNSAKALELLFQALRILESQRDSLHLVLVNKNIGDIFESQNDYARARHYYQNSVKYTSLFDIRSFLLSEVLLSLGEIYFNISELDSAEYSARRSEKLHPSTGAALLLGDIERKRGNKMKAMQYYRLSVAAESLITSTSVNLAKVYLRLAQEFKEDNQLDSGFYYSRLSLAIARQVKDPFGIADASKLLSVFFEQRNRLDSAYFYQQVVIKANDSLFTREKEKQIHNLVFNEQLRKQEVEAEKERLRSRAWIYTLAGGLFALLLIAVLLVRNIRQKKGANILLGRQKDQIENTLAELKATQAQLIQSEKMASLGELTAGIAHEIQNPLNFVNNFSELNTELIEEMKEELRTGKNEEAIAIANDIKNNEQKINYHGKRADSIVKGMLQHSRNSSGQKELTDINVLADECLRLSYHGIRAKDKSFNSGTQTEFDSKIPLVRIVPQEIGRVLLNLLTNAFYSVMQKNKQLGDNYEPMVLVKTSLQDSRVIVSVWDNGKGIPRNVIDKIFQPFFTTKPTGEGTGLGLSMSYDIVTKTHGGEFRVESAELEWAEFTIILPI
ncbi:MAG TPA: ATP-binding protein, partial [Chitinophagaceae bacterium]|nr:ATP-binding protein [Chitinophagaceae bacterium]